MTHYVEVYMVSGRVKELVLKGTMAQCLEFCRFYNWELVDENDFVWDLEIEEQKFRTKFKEVDCYQM